VARPDYRRSDFASSPLVVFYELTQACDLACYHCRASAQPRSNPRELGPTASLALIDELARFDKPPLLVLTGGDPMKRPDVYGLVEHATARGIDVAMTPSATPLVTRTALERLQAAGLKRLAVSIDGAEPATHDHFRGQPGSFARTTRILEDARSLGLPLQVNTTVTRHNVDELDRLADHLARQQIVLWSVFFLVPVGRASREDRISPARYEEVFEKLLAHSDRQPYAIKTTEAPHYRRFVAQHGRRALPGERDQTPLRSRPGMMGTNDGKGVMFVGHTGEIYPSGFLPLRCGRFPHDSVVDVYRSSPLFVSLRDAGALEGKCRRCEFRHVCGGSRARAHALTGNPLASDLDCVYEPGAPAP